MIWQAASKKSGLFFFLMGLFLVLFGLPALFLHNDVRALQPDDQSAADCSVCHKQAVDLLAESLHAGIPLKCDSCHKLVPGAEGAEHPELYYTTESEEITCATCHADASRQWYEGQHGDLNMTCATCHETHSLQQKLIGDNQTTCEACHKKQVDAGHGSTHEAAGVACSSCHIANETGHGFNATLATCNACHDDIHDANRLVVSGFEFAPASTDAEAAESMEEPASAEEAAGGEETAAPEGEEAEEPSAEPAPGGVNLPSWLLLIAGLLVGGGVTWVVIGKDPGIPTEEK